MVEVKPKKGTGLQRTAKKARQAQERRRAKAIRKRGGRISPALQRKLDIQAREAEQAEAKAQQKLQQALQREEAAILQKAEQKPARPLAPPPTIQRVAQVQDITSRIDQERLGPTVERAEREMREKAAREARQRPTIGPGIPKSRVARTREEFIGGFKTGFGLQPTLQQTVQAGTAAQFLGGTLGTTAAIGAAGIGRIGGTLLRPIPGVGRAATAIGSIFAKRKVQVILGGAAATTIGITGVQQGPVAATREAALIARDVAAFGGALKGAKLTGINARFDVNTFQDTSVIRGRGTIKGESFTEITTTTDLGKTSTTQINIGNRIIFIDRSPTITKISVKDARTLKTIQRFEEKPQTKSIKGRITGIEKQPVQRIVEIETPTAQELVSRQVTRARVEGEGFGPLRARVQIGLDVTSVSAQTTLALKPIRTIEEVARVADLQTGRIGIETVRREVQIGGVEFVEGKVPTPKDILTIEPTETGRIIQREAAPRVVSAEQISQIGRGEITIKSFERLGLFESKKGQLTLPARAPQQTFVTQVGVREPSTRLTGLEFTPSIELAGLGRPFSFVELPRRAEPLTAPSVERPTIIKPVIDTQIKPDVIPVSITEAISKQEVKPVSIARPVISARTRFVPIAETITDQKVGVSPVQRVISEVAPTLISVPVAAAKPFDTFVPLLTQPISRPSARIPTRVGLPDLDLSFLGAKPEKPGFLFEIGRPGLQTFITGRAETFGEAVSRATRGVLETPAATFKIKKDEKEILFGEEDVRRLAGRAFRPGKTGGVIQIATERIRSPGELLGITVKGQKARRKSLF